MMDVLVLDNDAERRRRFVDALDWLGCSSGVFEADALATANTWITTANCRVALIGPELAEGTMTAIDHLRRRLDEAQIVAYQAFDHRDRSLRQSFRIAGANYVFDSRMSSWKIALLLRPLMQKMECGLVSGLAAIPARQRMQLQQEA
ncbi:MAG TPA: hypothetical protein VI279_12160 [Rhodocyclaceae bacterium]